MNVGCRFNHNHTKSIYEDRTLLMINAGYLLSGNSLNVDKNALFVWHFGWGSKNVH
jgi:hypothetical protein